LTTGANISFFNLISFYTISFRRNSSKDSAAKVMFELLKLGQALFVTEFELEKIDNLKVFHEAKYISYQQASYFAGGDEGSSSIE